MGAREIIPTKVCDIDGAVVTVSSAAREELARLIATDAAYIYTPIGDPRFYQVWLNEVRDQRTGFKGVRIPLADWARAYDAERARSGQQQQQQQTA